MENLILRNAETADGAFLEDLFFDVRRDEFESAGLPLEHLKSLLSMQYSAQKQSYDLNFPNALHQIVELNDDRVGRLLTVRNAEKIHLIDVSILREFRGRGIGVFLLEKLKNEAETVSLTVFKTNSGALKLYEKECFEITGDAGMYFEMEWKRNG